MPELRPYRSSSLQQFDSVQSLVDFVGQPAIVSSPITIDQNMIDRFAQVTLDSQWIHVEPARAMAESPYGCTIAHGFLVLSLLTYWQSSCMAFPRASILLNYGFDKIRYTMPVPAGSSVSASFALAQVSQTKPSEARCSWNISISARNASRPSVHANWQVLVRYDQP